MPMYPPNPEFFEGLFSEGVARLQGLLSEPWDWIYN
jgi:hypothetical protein